MRFDSVGDHAGALTCDGGVYSPNRLMLPQFTSVFVLSADASDRL
ncbi:TPA: hypothetical protein ACNH9H_001787 [Pseudomonas aeruginosa]|nr:MULTISPECIES: hypothetical protein [Pseudomonas]MED5477543.1 hypothetical protein [Pseudomonadota bacterium]MCS7764174.1 hypothetical protein [Pseudomonas aeruginosa]MCS7772331.1 hypothetical protein [Pseudomonas aeruginosa]MCS8030496.1 hypothetical protein [Pseudomonas aeruginosa]MCS8128827.1 hypothetical protein [Pseudomonas aeruginosa]